MNAAAIQSKQNNTTHDAWLIWALVGSFLLHITLAYIIPSFKAAREKEKPKELKVELVKIQAPEPVVVPEPPKPEPPKPIVKPKPKPIKKKVVRKPKPTPLPEPEVMPEPVVEPPPVEVPQPVIAAEPTPAVEPEFVVPEPVEPPPPEPEPEPEPAGPTQADINAYRNQLYAEFKRNQRYPKMAQRRGIQGDVDLLIGLDDTGNVTNVSVAKSSGSSVLDKEAIKTVKRSNIQRLMPAILKGQINQIKVTLSFKLQ